ncbi:MAG: aminoglycoside 6-adenylyltransferase, partial [Oscillospiraceae bacterium]|nr:aminoglycoside 6-adenylyltransferase [Oscillospiraceae bacterium]
EIFAQYRDIFPHGDYAEIWEKLFLMYDLFAACARFVAEACAYPFNTQEDARVRAFLEKRFAEKED